MVGWSQLHTFTWGGRGRSGGRGGDLHCHDDDDVGDDDDDDDDDEGVM